MINQGIKIVGVEASCMSVMQDEFPDLAEDRKMALKISKNIHTIQDLLLEIQNDGKQQILWNEEVKDLLLLVHCHERALEGVNKALNSLNIPPNFSAKIIDSGCCGMAGSFGMEKEHYEISTKIAEDRLLPNLRKSKESQEIVP